ncbi:L-aminoadipate-semialdehyde dehydrogenase-phosphopantetheinyl transferase [Pyxicephalus adspersus]|uniref:L-aminoadipate-semialdehyde dehydrogenase-phosphopantetheinyl transferase n=1 Tax=Pyxicephalus adspersus TaxID=30357 RepID=UPI003B5B1C67
MRAVCRLVPMEGVRWAIPCARWAPSREEWLLCARCIQPEEKQRIGQFVFTRDAKAAMVYSYYNAKIISCSHSKPITAAPCSTSFLPLELAPEGSGSTEEFFRLMHRQFTEKEWHSIKSMAGDWAKLDMFYRHWALKESFIKAIGVGLGFSLQRVEFEVSPITMEVGKVYTETRMWLDEEPENWSFEEMLLDDKHHVAVALGDTNTNTEQTSKVNYHFQTCSARKCLYPFTWVCPEC